MLGLVLSVVAYSGCGAAVVRMAPAPPTTLPPTSQTAVSVALSPTGVTLPTGGQQKFVATVTGTENTSVEWQVAGINGGNAAVGTITSSGSYTAPSTPPLGGSVIVTAISAADRSKSGSAVVRVVAQPQPVNVAITPTNASVPSGQTQQFTAIVTGTANFSVIWAVNGTPGGDLTVGTISATGLYSAPATVPANPVVTVTAQSSYDPNISASATALITAPISANPGTVYYVDCNAANDSEDGRSPNGAWKTIARVNSSSFLPGDSILLKKGCTWREQLDVPSSGSAGKVITYGTYGTGAKPVISAADLVPVWSQYSQNVWQAIVTTQPNSVWFNGIHGTLVAGIGSINVANQWYWASSVLYVFSTLDPATAFSSPGIEAASRNRAVLISGKDYVTLDGLELTDGNANWTGTYTVANATHTTLQNCAAHGGYYSNVHIYKTTAETTDNVVANCDIADSYYSSQLVLDTADSNTIAGNRFSGQTGALADFLYLTRSNLNIVENNLLTGPVTNGIYVKDGSSSNTIRYNKLVNIGSSGVGIQMRGATAVESGNAVYYNVISGAGLAIQTDGDFGGGNDGTVIHGNTVYSTVNGGNGIHVNHTNTNCTIKNNLIVVSSGDALSVAPGSTAGTISDHNLLRNSSGTLIQWGTSAYLLSQFFNYQSASSQDNHSLTGDPTFRSIGSGDFSLLLGSPAIDSGADLGASYKMGLDPRSNFPWTTLDQSQFGSGWEMGAFVSAETQ